MERTLYSSYKKVYLEVVTRRKENSAIMSCRIYQNANEEPQIFQSEYNRVSFFGIRNINGFFYEFDFNDNSTLIALHYKI